MLTEIDKYVISNNASGYRHPLADRLNAILIRAYGDAARDVILAKRRENVIKETLRLRHWQSSVSRRIQRGNHDDSWTTREQTLTNRYSLDPAMYRKARLLWHMAHPEARRNAPKYIRELLGESA